MFSVKYLLKMHFPRQRLVCQFFWITLLEYFQHRKTKKKTENKSLYYLYVYTSVYVLSNYSLIRSNIYIYIYIYCIY